jgi:hypothetical protein
MRQYSHYANSELIQEELNVLADRTSSVEAYSNALYQLGLALGQELKKHIRKDQRVVLACSSEDTDQLAKGIWDSLENPETGIAVFWNARFTPEGYSEPIAPIVKKFQINTEACDVLIIAKSIVYSSCVVRTNLTELIQTISPQQIFIASPVLFNKAENNLRSEFPSSISNKFEFVYFAIDDQENEAGEVIPGIGGSIYTRLGLGDATAKISFVPEMVKEMRRERV